MAQKILIGKDLRITDFIWRTTFLLVVR